MNKVKIICDSTIDLNPSDYRDFDIEIVPLEVNFGTESFLDGVNIDPDKMYEKIKGGDVFPKTAAVSPGRLLEVFKPWIDKGYDIVYTGIGSKMSVSHQNACTVAEQFPGRIYVVDSANLSSGTGLLVMKMCKYRDEGKSAKEIYDLVTPLVPKVVCQFVVDTLEFLHRGGRCSGATKLFGHLLHIHPVIKVVDGGMIVYKKPRGKHLLCCNVLNEDLKEDWPNVDLDHIMVTHSGCSDETINHVKQLVEDVVGTSKHTMVTRAGCVVSCHCGPNTIGILYIKK